MGSIIGGWRSPSDEDEYVFVHDIFLFCCGCAEGRFPYGFAWFRGTLSDQAEERGHGTCCGSAFGGRILILKANFLCMHGLVMSQSFFLCGLIAVAWKRTKKKDSN